MKRILLCATALILLSFFNLSAQNLISNGDFETGDPADGWTLGYNNQIESADVYAGVYSGRMKSGDAAFTQIITVIPGATYDVSLSAKWISAGNNIKIVFKDNANNSKVGQTSTIGATTWTTINEQLEVPAGVTELKVIIWKGAGVGPCLIDNVSFAQATATAIDQNETLEASVYPNPLRAGSDLNIQLDEEGAANVEILNVNGQVVYSDQSSDSSNGVVRVSASELSTPGVYVVKVSSGDKAIVQKLVVQ